MLCSPSKPAEGRACDRLHSGQGVCPEHGARDCTRMCPVRDDVAEEEIQRHEGPVGERLCSPGQTPECGEICHHYRLNYDIFSKICCKVKVSDPETFSPPCTPSELTLVPAGEFQFSTEANIHP